MAYVKINPTGCAERKGLVQVRFDCYLEPTDAGVIACVIFGATCFVLEKMEDRKMSRTRKL